MRTRGRGGSSGPLGLCRLWSPNDCGCVCVGFGAVYGSRIASTARAYATAQASLANASEAASITDDDKLWSKKKRERFPHGFWLDIKNHTQLFNQLMRELGLKELSDWYNVTRKQIVKLAGATVFAYYTSVEEAVRTIYPQYPWESSLFVEKSKFARPAWTDLHYQKAFLDKVGQELGIGELSGWYNVARADLVERGGSGLFNHYRSIEQILRRVYPDYKWDSSKFLDNPRSPPGYWTNPVNQKKFLDDLAKELNITDLSDWYQVTRKQVKLRGGAGLFYSHSSVYDLVKDIYPDYDWDPTKWAEYKLPNGYWSIVDNQLRFLERVGKELGVKELSDWYKVTRKDLFAKGGQSLFMYYPSTEHLLRTVYPDYQWDSSKFTEPVKEPRGSWVSVMKQKGYLEEIGKKIGVKQMTDWYKVQRKQLEDHGGSSLFHYHRTLPEALKAIYPDFPWDPSGFTTGKAPMGYWNDKANLFKVIDKAEAEIGITTPEDWYSVTLAELREIGLPRTTSKLQLVELLEEKYPGYRFDRVFMLRGKYAQQKRLERSVRILFPGAEIIANARREADLVNPKTEEFLELDVYVPSLNLAFEYQELHHYAETRYYYKPLDEIQQRDREKMEMAQQKGITLVVVPCWWDGKEDSLIATIKKTRPDLLKDHAMRGEAIPEEMPPRFLERSKLQVEGIGVPVSACFFTKSDADPTDWWLFEKYDGLRGFWHPEKKVFYSRFGNQFLLPKEITDSMPTDLFLDGEIWFGRDNFHEATKISNRTELAGVDWSKFKYMVYDVPNHQGTYSERYNLLEERLKDKNKYRYLEVAPKEVCMGTEHLDRVFQDILDKGGEGIILRDPNAPFEAGRSRGYLKHKKFRDAEARVVRRIGELQYECELPDGIVFTAPVGTLEFAKRWQPQPGDIVSFKYRGFLLGTRKPKLPTIYRMRTDLTWETVVANWKEKKPTFTALPIRRPVTTKKKKGYWAKTENRRRAFCEFAKEMGFDPLDPEGWKNVASSTFIAKMGKSILYKFNSRLKPALEHDFPDMRGPIQETKGGYWKDIHRCREFFDDFAKEKGFDPLNAESWYSLELAQVQSIRGGLRICQYHGGFRKALKKMYPEVKFEKWDATPEQHSLE